VTLRERFRGGGSRSTPSEAAPEPTSRRTIRVTVNGEVYEREVDVRRTLGDFIREDLRLTGLHYGCEHGVCGACTVLLDGSAVRSCLMLAVQVDGRSLKTIEGMASSDGELHPIQQAFWDQHGLQCGFCTPGMLMTVYEFLNQADKPTEDEIREALAGNLCRCTGYVNIVKAVQQAAGTLVETGGH
jgi:aerobic carbon-monoxide dehydrogenase small subunit